MNEIVNWKKIRCFVLSERCSFYPAHSWKLQRRDSVEYIYEFSVKCLTPGVPWRFARTVVIPARFYWFPRESVWLRLHCIMMPGPGLRPVSYLPCLTTAVTGSSVMSFHVTQDRRQLWQIEWCRKWNIWNSWDLSMPISTQGKLEILESRVKRMWSAAEWSLCENYCLY